MTVEKIVYSRQTWEI